MQIEVNAFWKENPPFLKRVSDWENHTLRHFIDGKEYELSASEDGVSWDTFYKLIQNK